MDAAGYALGNEVGEVPALVSSFAFADTHHVWIILDETADGLGAHCPQVG
jgi:hypothetical protein